MSGEDKKVYSKEEMEMWIKVLVKEMPKHDTPSGETRKEIAKINNTLKDLNINSKCVNHEQRLYKMEIAIYGDKKDDTNPGMKVQLDDIHKFFISATGARKIIMYFFGGIATITAGFIAFRELIKSLAH